MFYGWIKWPWPDYFATQLGSYATWPKYKVFQVGVPPTRKRSFSWCPTRGHQGKRSFSGYFIFFIVYITNVVLRKGAPLETLVAAARVPNLHSKF